MLAQLGRRCHERRGVVVVAWLVLLLVVGGIAAATGSGFETQFKPPHVESQRGLDILNRHFGGQGGGLGGQIVFRSRRVPITDPSVAQPLQAFLARVDARPDVMVQSPFTASAGAPNPLVSSRGPLAGHVAYARVEPAGGDLTIEQAAAVTDAVQAAAPSLPGVEIEYGGQLFERFQPPSSETIGLGFAVVILILAFGSVLAMGLPIGTAAAGIGVGVAIVTALSTVLTMPNFTTTLGVMIGLGVGIDYALFIVTRYRENVHQGLDSATATSVAVDTAGRAVLFAGTTVVISLLGMLLMGLAFVRGLAIGAATVVLVTMIASVTLLPALLGFVRHRVEVSRWRGVVAAGLVAVGLIGLGLKVTAFAVLLPLALAVVVAGFFVPALKREVPRRAAKPAEQTLAHRWSRVLQRRPWVALLAGLAVLVLLALPVFAIRLGFSDEGNFPTSTTTRRAYDLLAQGFGPGSNGPFLLAAELPAGTTPQAVAGVQPALARTPGVAFASPAIPAPDGRAVLWQVVPASAPQDRATGQLLHRLRGDVLPAASQGSGVDIAVTGGTAISADFSEYLGNRLPLFIGVVLALSFLLLMAVFRSLLVPLKAVLLNLLSIGAAYGLVVAVFQWGWGKQLVGVGKGGPIEPFIPMMMFAIVFGLSMDYEVFLLSRMKEEYDRGAANDIAVANGLAATARVITAAALIMVVVFGSFLLETERTIKIFGVGLASAVLLDATVVRMLLVPATMELLGDRNWWLPAWLDRLLPDIDVEGHAVPVPGEVPAREGELSGVSG